MSGLTRSSVLAVVVVVLVVSTTALLAFAGGINFSTPYQPDIDYYYKLGFALELDPENHAAIQVRDFSEDSSNNKYAYVTSSLPEVFVVDIKNEKVLFRSGEFSAPISGFNLGPIVYTDTASDDVKGVGWVSLTSAYNKPTLFYYDRQKNGTLIVPLDYKSNPLPVSMKVMHDAKKILIGDNNGYLACYDKYKVDGIRRFTVKYTGTGTVTIRAARDDHEGSLIAGPTDLTSGQTFVIDGGSSDLPNYTYITIRDKGTGNIVDAQKVNTSGNKLIEIGMKLGSKLEVTAVTRTLHSTPQS